MKLYINSLRNRVLVVILAGVIPIGALSAGELNWENLNPGAGGQIQDVVPDPHHPGRLLYCSDVDGAYLTEDDGATWEYVTRETSSSNALTGAFDPTDPQRVYLGMHTGLALSDDGGRTWTNAFDSEIMHDPIMAIVVDPNDSQVVYAAPSNRNRWTEKEGRIGPRGVWISRDRGQRWNYVVYNRKEGPRDVYSISTVPGRAGLVIVAGYDGVYSSADYGRTWANVRAPEKKSARSWGATVSPDGAWFYASYEAGEGEARLYGIPTDQLGERKAWLDLFAMGDEPKAGSYWIPRMDPRSSATEHRFLSAAFDNPPFGLVEFTVKLDGGEIGSFAWRQLLSWEGGNYGRKVNPANRYTQDVGWEQYYTRPLSWHYTPIEWGDTRRGIWTTKDQTVFFADNTSADFPYNWEQRYCDFVSDIEGVRTYRTRGANCTVIFDAVAFENYAIMCNADNGVTESWDDGYSWSIVTRPLGNIGSRSNSAAIVQAKGRTYALAHVATGWGAASYNGRLFAKKLETLTPKDNWKLVAGGKEEQFGLPDHKYSAMISDPHKPERIYVVASTKILSYNPWRSLPGAVYVCEDIVDLIENGRGGFTKVGGEKPSPTLPEDQNRGLQVDPHDANTLYLGSEKVVWKATRPDEQSVWTWEPLLRGRWIASWSVDGQTSLAVSNADNIFWSPKGGRGDWFRVFRLEDAVRLRQPAWYRGQALEVNAMVEHNQRLYFTVHTTTAHDEHRGLGIFCLDLSVPEKFTLSDLTGDLPLKRLMNARIVEKDGVAYYYASTWGNGLWRLKLP